MNTMRGLSIPCFICLAVGVVAGAPAARADDCQLAAAAAIAQAKVPHAITSVMLAPGRPAVRNEVIMTETAVYTQSNGTWRAMPMSTQQQLDMIDAATKRMEQSPHDCQKTGGGSINGEAASLLTAHYQVNGGATEARMWISDKSGLPLKNEVHLASGMVVTNEFRYNHITPPAGVK